MKQFGNIFVIFTIIVIAFDFNIAPVNGILKPLKLIGKLILKKELKSGGLGGSGGGGGDNIFIGIGIQCNGGSGCNRQLTTGDVGVDYRNHVGPQGGSAWSQSNYQRPVAAPQAQRSTYHQTASTYQSRPSTSSSSHYGSSNTNQYSSQQSGTYRWSGQSAPSGNNRCAKGCFYDQSIGGCNCNYRSVLSR